MWLHFTHTGNTEPGEQTTGLLARAADSPRPAPCAHHVLWPAQGDVVLYCRAKACSSVQGDTYPRVPYLGQHENTGGSYGLEPRHPYDSQTSNSEELLRVGG